MCCAVRVACCMLCGVVVCCSFCVDWRVPFVGHCLLIGVCWVCSFLLVVCCLFCVGCGSLCFVCDVLSVVIVSCVAFGARCFLRVRV